MSDIKVCTICMEKLPATTEYFYEHKKCKNNLNPKCKLCFSEYYRTNKVEKKKKQKERYIKKKAIIIKKQIISNKKRDDKFKQEKGYGYTNLHDYIRRRKQKPKCCEVCETNLKKLFLHSKNHEYTRNLGDWLYLCSICHQKLNKKIK